MSVDEIVDKLIAKHTKEEEKPKETEQEPFRYLTSEEDIKQELSKGRPTPFSVMKLSQKMPSPDNFLTVVSLGSSDEIENIIRRHEEIRKLKL